MTDDRIGWHLENWAEWMDRGTAGGAGYSSRASGGMGRSHSRDFDSMVAESDNRCAIAVDAVLDSMNPAERGSIHHFHIAAVYGFRDPVKLVYDRARAKLGRELDARGIP